MYVYNWFNVHHGPIYLEIKTFNFEISKKENGTQKTQVIRLPQMPQKNKPRNKKWIVKSGAPGQPAQIVQQIHAHNQSVSEVKGQLQQTQHNLPGRSKVKFSKCELTEIDHSITHQS